MTKRLSAKSETVLSLIADGHSYSQIVDSHPDLSYLDIFSAAEEALRLNESSTDHHDRMERIKQRYPRAYAKWDEQEDAELARMHHDGVSVIEIAKHLQRQPSAINSRMAKLGLVLKFTGKDD